MGSASVSGWTWPSGREQHSSQPGHGAGGPMARRTFDVVDIIEILVHWHAGRNNSEIAQSLGVDRKTTRKYVAAAQAAGMRPGGPPVSEERWAELVRLWFPELSDTRLRQVTWPAIEAHHDYIGEQLKAGVTVTTIHQRLRDERGLAVSIASFRRYVAANLPEETRRSQVKVLRPWPAEPGAEAQIDYGRLGRWADPAAGKLVTVWAFVMVLACSRHLFVRPVIRLDQQAWSQCHVAAFAFFGGVPARLVPDNLKTGVDRPDLYDPKINRSYAELAAHYGCLVDPARAYRPADKPRVERPMPYVRDSFWRGREFASLAQMQSEAVRWSLEVAGHRSCRPLDGAAPAAVFAAAEKDTLKPVPADPFVLATWARAKIGPDIHARVGKVLYSCRGGISARAPTCGSPTRWCSSSSAGSWSRPTRARPGASRPTSATTRRRRSPSTCAPRPGAAARPPASARHASRSSASCWPTTPSTGCAPPRAWSAWPTGVTRPGSRPPAPGPWLPGTRPTAPSRASWPPAPTATSCPRPRRPGTAARARSCTGPRRSPTSWPCALRARSPATSRTCPPRAAARRDGHDPPRHGHRPHRPGPGAADPEAVRHAGHPGRPPDPGRRRGPRPPGLPAGPVRRRDHPPGQRLDGQADPPGPVRRTSHPRGLRLRRQSQAARRADPRPGRAALAARRGIGHPLRPRRRRQDPRRPGARAPGHPLLRRDPVPQDQPRARPPGRRPRRPDLGQAAPRAHPPGRADPGRFRHARADRRPGRRPV